MRGNHVERVGEIESVDGFLKNTIFVVDIDRTAAGCRTRIGLGDQKEFVDGIKFDVRATEELILPGIRQYHGEP